jgi:hypothetical protein
MKKSPAKINLGELSGVCFDSPSHELLPSKHWMFSLLPTSSEFVQINKWRTRYALNNHTNPYHAARQGLLFVHIPKNAGTSFFRTLFGSKAITEHFSAQFYHQLNKVNFEKSLKIAVVRDPDERFVSAVNFNRYTSSQSADREFGNKFLNYDSMDTLCQSIDRNDSLFDHVSRHVHFRRQVGYVCDSDGEVIVDLLISMNSLVAGLKEVGRVVGRDFTLEHRNVSPRQNIGFKMSGRMREYFEPDFRLWDFVSKSEQGFVWMNTPSHEI